MYPHSGQGAKDYFYLFGKICRGITGYRDPMPGDRKQLNYDA